MVEEERADDEIEVMIAFLATLGARDVDSGNGTEHRLRKPQFCWAWGKVMSKP